MLRLTTSRTLSLFLLCFGLAGSAAAQAPAAVRPKPGPASATGGRDTETPPASDLDEIRRQLREQQQELERMRATITEQSQLIDELRRRTAQAAPEQQTIVNGGAKPGEISATDALPAAAAPGDAAGQAQADERLKSVEEQVKKNTETIARQLGTITFSGDFRLRYESIFGQLNATANGNNPLILGNVMSSRNRFRIRARLNIRGRIGTEFDWGLRLGTSSFADTISNNQTLTDFFNRKPFGLDNMYIAWTPRRLPGLRVQGGKFDVPWIRTEMTIDNDLNPEGLSQAYSRPFKNRALKNLTFIAWQLPFLERNSAFVRNANGTFNRDESGSSGRDLALYGAQVHARFEPSPTVALTLSLADLYFSGTQFISPI